MFDYVQPIDIAERLYFRKRHWYHGNPKISLVGKVGSFGTLKFDFVDEVVEMRIYICNKEHILDAADMAVKNMNSLCERLLEVWQ